MKIIGRPYRQGDVLLVPVDGIADGTEIASNDGRVILAYGEATGHHHSIASHDNVTLFRPDDMPAGSMVLKVEGDAVTLEHQEHSPIEIPPGLYQVVIQVEETPGVIRQVID